MCAFHNISTHETFLHRNDFTFTPVGLNENFVLFLLDFILHIFASFLNLIFFPSVHHSLFNSIFDHLPFIHSFPLICSFHFLSVLYLFPPSFPLFHWLLSPLLTLLYSLYSHHFSSPHPPDFHSSVSLFFHPVLFPPQSLPPLLLSAQSELRTQRQRESER